MTELTVRDGQTALALARTAIADRLTGDGSLAAALRDLDVTPGLAAARGVFVTLKQPGPGGRLGLRGCLGSMCRDEPFYRAVVDVAPRAALLDPRFPPIEREELPRIRLEISALTPLVPVDSPERIVPGRDGVQLTLGRARAVFLPQVAVEHGWDVDRLLRELAVKAGLAPEGWRAAGLESFRAEVFVETLPGAGSRVRRSS